ncbi:hypothetical protein ACTWJ9_33160 (plasmid) [Streptomyces sp. GDS52]|uniref:hypothetical protein n=1 Tax=Streptomyces sp. GDS52 TaxID=3406419 RepID=UPI003FD58730
MRRPVSKRELLRRLERVEALLGLPTPPPLAGQETIPDALFNTPHGTHRDDPEPIDPTEK